MPTRAKRGRPPMDRRRVAGAILYVVRSGCQWRMLPGDFPNWSTVDGNFRRWRIAGVWQRVHDRKLKLFEWLVHNPPEQVDVLLMEGTTISRPNAEQRFPSEVDLEAEFIRPFAGTEAMPLVWCSRQNMDRIVSVFRACKRSGGSSSTCTRPMWYVPQPIQNLLRRTGTTSMCSCQAANDTGLSRIGGSMCRTPTESTAFIQNHSSKPQLGR
ncbi:MAG: transposase [Planctomycetales bacterium]|nr:transposase [Planctomycetales bacterium]